MLKSICFFTLMTLASLVGLSQQITGSVRDDIDGEPLVGANVVLDDSTSLSVTDQSGDYSFSEVTSGRHLISVSYVGYKHAKVYDIWVKNGKVTTTDILLSRDFTGLEEIVITEPQGLSEIGRMTISEEQINRFAATYYDPARLVTISPDVAVANDQNNRISVRGISPNYNVWRLEDVEIVNPNHLSNAGTFSDQPSSTGGGVNILSAQMLDNSAFLYSGFAATYGNSVGGIFDMHLRKGNKRERQYTAQASLIGFDFSAEGPFSENGDASYIINYRYSFTGLLAAMGVDFGGESIGFQDLSFNVNKPLGEKGNISFFGIGGLNFNNFDAKLLDESEVQKDRSDIYYNGKMGAVGTKLNYQVGSGQLKFSAAISSSNNRREQNFYDQNQTIEAENDSENKSTIYSFNGQYDFKVGSGQLTVGSLFNVYQFDYFSEVSGTFTGSSPFIIGFVDAAEDIGYSYFNPYLNVSFPLLDVLHLDLGVNYNTSSLDDQKVDPRGKLTFYTGPNSEIYLSAGLYSQLLNPTNYYFIYSQAGGDYYATLQPYDFIQSLRYTAGYHLSNKKWNYNIEGFYYDFPDININATGFGASSTARSYGVSVMGTRTFVDNWYMNFGASFFDSTWGDDQPNRFNLKKNINASAGKEWFFENKPVKRSLGLNAKVIYQGGLMDPVVESGLIGPPSTTNSDYYRVDLRVQWTRYLGNRTTSISLDLQNISNNENDAYTYYDGFTGQREQQTQLGLIPILTYRMEF